MNGEGGRTDGPLPAALFQYIDSRFSLDSTLSAVSAWVKYLYTNVSELSTEKCRGGRAGVG